MLPWRRKRLQTMDIRLERLGPNFKKQVRPACSSCGYDADWILRLGLVGDEGTLERLFCEKDLVNALLDAANFSVHIPDALEAA